MTPIRRLALNTGGGDAPGLNAVIRAVVLTGLNRGWEIYGIREGYDGLLSGDSQGVIRLDKESVRDLTHMGGTILGTTNRGNPLKWPVTLPDGTMEMHDRSGEVVEAFHQRGLDALVAIGGDGSLSIASELHEAGLPVIGVPKTIDNDLAATQVTFGFHTAVQTATDALDRLRSTAQSHRRVMVVEVMGRDTGWIALFAGLSGSAHVILIPEIPYDTDAIIRRLQKEYEAGGAQYGIVVAAEGAQTLGGDTHVAHGGKAGASPRYGGIAESLAQEIGERSDMETRAMVLGHLQRGGQPTAYDRLLALRFGAAAVELAAEGRFGCMVALDPPDILAVPLKQAIAERKMVPVDGDVVRTARALGIGFGDEK